MAEPKDLRLRALHSHDAIELIADKWRIPILHVLLRLRSGELQKAMAEVLPKGKSEISRGNNLTGGTRKPALQHRTESITFLLRSA